MVEARERFIKEKRDKVGWSAETPADVGSSYSLLSPVQRGSMCGSRSFCVVALAETRNPPPPSDPQAEDTQIQAPSRVHPGRVVLVCRAEPLGLRRTTALDLPLLLF